MKHAGADALDRLEPLLAELRALPSLVEKSRGIFYNRPRLIYRVSRSFVHFHEDPKGLFADLRAGTGEFDRFRVEDEGERARFLTEVLHRVRSTSEAPESASG